MKVVILAGGLGTRISEESHLKPKPMIEIGGRPIIWHIMKHYSQFGFDDFVICCGYKGYMIKEYFANYLLHVSDVTIDLQNDRIDVHHRRSESWRITLIDTGEHSMTGGRLKRVAPFLDDRFFLTYGDGVSDVDIGQLLKHHEASGCAATVTGIQPKGRFGSLELDGDNVVGFHEKLPGDGQWINGGFFVCEPSVLDLIDGDDVSWERAPLIRLAQDRQLSVYKHNGFWAAMDTLRDKHQLEELWESGAAPWRSWA
ncbi:glucose-1-phosphate cytidylyltransferase [Oceanicaulis alexandrii]|uniref:glucose-1-phosphate cytidylyltransferase n=1 Tax=Oceanicaulis alexandrii TaxID=153233 RepID=UPI003B50A223